MPKHVAQPLAPQISNKLETNGDGSALFITPTGEAAPRTAADIAADAGKVRPPPPFALLWQSEEVSLENQTAPAAPGTTREFYTSRAVDFASFGGHVDQNLFQEDAVITKAGPGGTRIVTHDALNPNHPGGASLGFPGEPLYPDAALQGLEVGVRVLMDSPAGNYPAGQETVADDGGQGLVGVLPCEVGQNDPVRGMGHNGRYVQFFARRTDVALDPTQVALYADRKIHFNVTGPDSRIEIGLYDIPAARNVVVVDEVIDLRKYGLSSYSSKSVLLYEFMRNGEIIRAEVTPMTFPGEVFDPPTYPLYISARGITPTPLDDYKWESNNSNKTSEFSGITLYGITDSSPPMSWDYNRTPRDREAWFQRSVANCTEYVRTAFNLRIWRPDTDGDASYVPARGAAPIPIPVGAKDGCKIRVSVLHAGPRQQDQYPFASGDPDHPTTMGLNYNLGLLEERVIPSVSLDKGDVDATLQPGDHRIQRWATPLTANRVVTLATVGGPFGVRQGDWFRVVRTGLGAFTLDVGGLKTIPAATAAFVEVMFDGSTWVLIGYGLL